MDTSSAARYLPEPAPPDPTDPGGGPRSSPSPPGYLHPLYARSLNEFGRPRHLPESDGWILEREIGATRLRDAMACYPLLLCRDWSRLPGDLEGQQDLVSVAVVLDPFGDHTPRLRARAFPEVSIPFKEHFVTDLARSPDSYLSYHHQRNVRKGLRQVRVEIVARPGERLEDWIRVYGVLIRRHRVTGLRAFSPLAFRDQLTTPGMVAFRAGLDGSTVGMLLWFVHGRVAYYHLGACDETGYRVRASFAMFRTAIGYFSDLGLRWLDLGGDVGLARRSNGGLARFKRGWATGTRMAYFCGRIGDRSRYRELAGNDAGNGYFPAYRRNEFAAPSEVARS